MGSVGRKPIEVTKEMQGEAMRLASLGFNEKQISEAIGLNYVTFQNKKEHFLEFLKKGRMALRERITSSLLARADDGDTTALIFTCKRLNLFSNTLDVVAPNNVQEAMAQLLNIYMAFSNGEITDVTADKMTSMLQGYIKAFEVNELETRLKMIEEKVSK